MIHYPFVPGRSAELRLGRVSEAYGCYCITKVVNRRLRVLAQPTPADILTHSFAHLRLQNRIKLFAFCIMPDHYHMAFCLMPDATLSAVMESISKFTSRKINKFLGRRGTFWQEGFVDHHCRNDSELYEICLYIEHNPVRNLLVKSADEWPYSSAHVRNKHLLDREWWP
jgi:REP element-mobilizing transposase RayT